MTIHNAKTLTRRHALGLGAAGLSGLCLSQLGARGAFAQDAMGGDMMSEMIETGEGGVTILPVNHASLALKAGDTVIYADPVGDPGAYADLPPPNLILITHEHGDHYNADTLAALAGDSVPLITNPAVYGMLPDSLKARATAIGNGESAEGAGVSFDAVPAYNITEDRLNYHPQGRDNGYVFTLGGARIYLAGDTEATPEFRAQTGIDLAFVPMNLPFTMDVGQAADGVIEMAPKVIYPYHYRGSNLEAFKQMVDEAGKDIEVRLYDWYA
ncbi:MBL fold metallo-hydrolase [Cucumibacter marinus]|uniref:MBL fold metallo-hydrolase n=1 Tax=Cucumibacter marinus TaxID=1121252 RepID=UPI0004229DA5|nr:MBL fold metallo-hydrolase [Cucumibacter marinus]